MYRIVEGENYTNFWHDETNASFPRSSLNSRYRAMLKEINSEGASIFDGDIPDEVQADANQLVFDEQLEEYKQAVRRLERYRVADGQPEVTEQVPVDPPHYVYNEETEENDLVTVEVVTQQAVEAVPATVTKMVFDEADPTAEATEQEIPNPLIVKDDEERAAAQAVVDATPQAVKDAA